MAFLADLLILGELAAQKCAQNYWIGASTTAPVEDFIYLMLAVMPAARTSGQDSIGATTARGS
jgi:hypothetical protein